MFEEPTIREKILLALAIVSMLFAWAQGKISQEVMARRRRDMDGCPLLKQLREPPQN